MISFHRLLLFSIIHHDIISSIYCPKDRDCQCIADEKCELKCNQSHDWCKGDIELTCKPNYPCILYCTADVACQDATLYPNNASSIHVYCSGIDACSGDMEINCQSNALCSIQCANCGSNLRINDNNAAEFECIGDCPKSASPPYIAPTKNPTYSPTTATPTSSPVTFSPSRSPSEYPTFEPSTSNPSAVPSTNYPSISSIIDVTLSPTISPTYFPTDLPNHFSPTKLMVAASSKVPSKFPLNPTKIPTRTNVVNIIETTVKPTLATTTYDNNNNNNNDDDDLLIRGKSQIESFTVSKMPDWIYVVLVGIILICMCITILTFLVERCCLSKRRPSREEGIHGHIVGTPHNLAISEEVKRSVTMYDIIKIEDRTSVVAFNKTHEDENDSLHNEDIGDIETAEEEDEHAQDPLDDILPHSGITPIDHMSQMMLRRPTNDTPQNWPMIMVDNLDSNDEDMEDMYVKVENNDDNINTPQTPHTPHQEDDDDDEDDDDETVALKSDVNEDILIENDDANSEPGLNRAITPITNVDIIYTMSEGQADELVVGSTHDLNTNSPIV